MGRDFFTARPEPLTPAKKRGMAVQASRASVSGQRRIFPLWGQHRARAPQRRDGYIAEPGGSIRDEQVIETCDKYGIVMAFTGMRLFHH